MMTVLYISFFFALKPFFLSVCNYQGRCYTIIKRKWLNVFAFYQAEPFFVCAYLLSKVAFLLYIFIFLHRRNVERLIRFTKQCMNVSHRAREFIIVCYRAV
ncbi:unnamed protein product [Ixodes persulcatus]